MGEPEWQTHTRRQSTCRLISHCIAVKSGLENFACACVNFASFPKISISIPTSQTVAILACSVVLGLFLEHSLKSTVAKQHRTTKPSTTAQPNTDYSAHTHTSTLGEWEGYQGRHHTGGHAQGERAAEDPQEDAQGLEQGHHLEGVAVVPLRLVGHDGSVATRQGVMTSVFVDGSLEIVWFCDKCGVVKHISSTLY